MLKKILITGGAGVLLLIAYFIVQTNPTTTAHQNDDGLVVLPVKTKALIDVFKDHSYDMSNHILNQKPIPRIFVSSVPTDFNQTKYDNVRPALFTEMLMPIILKANQTLVKERKMLLDLKKQFYDNKSLTLEETKTLQEISKRYDQEFSDDFAALFFDLMPKVDSIPPTLLLAISADETGFATSVYARKYNSLFHQKDWDGNGIVPEEKQPDGPQYHIKTFKTLYEAILSYTHYINTSGYFESFRQYRKKYRDLNENVSGYLTANLLMNFPYKPFKYPDILQYIIKQYNLFLLDLQELEINKESTPK